MKMTQPTCCRQTNCAVNAKPPRHNHPLFALLLSMLLLCSTLPAANPLHALAARGAVLPSAMPMTAATVATFFDQLVAQQMNDAHAVGATVAVVKDGALLFAKGYGYADLAQKVPVVADKTLFFPGSTGKLFTWTALMQLVEQGKLDLQTDINQYLDFQIPATLRQAQGNTFAEPITLAHLLTHTAGFEEQFAALLVAGQADVRPLGTFLRATLPARVYAPGTTFAYSNYGTALAGYIVERVSGEPYAQYITDHILTPLGMTSSMAGQPLSPPLLADLAKGYHYRNGQFSAVDFEWLSAVPAAPVHTTATDMAQFMLAYLNQGHLGDAQILQPATSVAMLTKQFAHAPQVNGVGYGFMVSTQNEQTIAWHTGGSAYFSTMLALIPAEKVGFFISYNTPVADLYQPLVSFVDHFYPVPPVATVVPPVDTAAHIAALSGNYISARVARTSSQKLATWQAESLTVQRGANHTLQVGARTYAETAPGLFRQIDGPRLLTYRTDAQGAVTQLFWGQFAYFKIPLYQTAMFQLIVAASALLIMLSGAIAWPIMWFIQRQRGRRWPQWCSTARWVAALMALFNTALLAWLLMALLTYADTLVYPVVLITSLTQLWWINLPASLLLLAFTQRAWRQHTWPRFWRIHYTLVTLAALLFVVFLLNWHLLYGL